MKQTSVRPVVWPVVVIMLLASSAFGCATNGPKGSSGADERKGPYEVKTSRELLPGTFRLLFDSNGKINVLEVPDGTKIKQEGRLPETPIRTKAVLNAASIEILRINDDNCVIMADGYYRCW